MLSLHELNVFVEAAMAENFSTAAHRLSLSQPAVSLQVRNLEKQLGVDLFRRNGRNVSLSDAGKVLLPMAQRLLSEAKQIEEVMWGLQGVVLGTLSVACSTTVGKYILPRLIAGFKTCYPDVQVAVNVMGRRQAMDRLLEGQSDLAVVSTHIGHRDCESESLVEDEIVLIVPAGHRWSDGRSIETQELLEEQFIMREPAAGSYEVLSEGLMAHNISVSDLRTVMTLGNAEAIEMSVEAGLGCAFVSRFVACRGLAVGRVAEVPVKGLRLTRDIAMVRHGRRAATPPQQAFWAFAFAPEHADIRRLPAI